MINIFKKNYLPKEIVLDCLEYYENTDIFLKKSEKYSSLKSDLLSFNKVSYNHFRQFILDTRSNVYTNFCYYKHENHKNYFSSDAEADVYFKDILYIKPNLWDKEIYKKVRKIFESTKKEYLLIDLRGSSGGYLNQCLDICNLILPECEVVSLKYKRKDIIHYSNSVFYPFKKIFIAIDKYTASSSEILAYSLYANLENVTLFGEKTFGKIFGQDQIVNKKYNFYFLVPSFWWSIKNFTYENVCINNIEDSLLSEIKKIV